MTRVITDCWPKGLLPSFSALVAYFGGSYGSDGTCTLAPEHLAGDGSVSIGQHFFLHSFYAPLLHSFQPSFPHCVRETQTGDEGHHGLLGIGNAQERSPSFSALVAYFGSYGMTVPFSEAPGRLVVRYARNVSMTTGPCSGGLGA